MKRTMNLRSRVLVEARRWIGTPYRHQGSCLGAGCDCLGLAYTPDWAERHGGESLLEAAQRHLVEIDIRNVKPGDVLLFRPELKGPAKHCAIVSGPTGIIHAYWGRSVAETALSHWWQRRLVAAFSFPERAR